MRPPRSKPERRFVVACGDPFMGIVLYGPFTAGEAEIFAESCSDCDWWIAELNDPKDA